jgi:dTDP-4-dehydrorhamnose 3,5-epimerase
MVSEVNRYHNSNISGFAIIRNSPIHDNRGSFLEWFNRSNFDDVGVNFEVKQANLAVSKKNVVRGIHFSDKKHVQNKLLICVSGQIIDYGVDLRKNSPTFGKYDKFDLNSESGEAVFIQHGIGHAYEVLSETAIVAYLLTEQWNPDFEYTLNPNDSKIGIKWKSSKPILSDRDSNALSINELESRLIN